MSFFDDLKVGDYLYMPQAPSWSGIVTRRTSIGVYCHNNADYLWYYGFINNEAEMGRLYALTKLEGYLMFPKEYVLASRVLNR